MLYLKLYIIGLFFGKYFGFMFVYVVIMWL